jgi:ABC-type Fe3+-hydroxamate transport system substrate-binding protein
MRFFGAAALLVGSLAGLPEGGRLAAAAGNETGRIVVDMADRAVSVPQHVHRVACFEVLCYEKFFLLGGGGQVAAMYRTDPPWMSTIDANVTHIPKVENVPNREELLKDGVDIVFLRYDRLKLRGLASAGMPAIVS